MTTTKLIREEQKRVMSIQPTKRFFLERRSMNSICMRAKGYDENARPIEFKLTWASAPELCVYNETDCHWVNKYEWEWV